MKIYKITFLFVFSIMCLSLVQAALYDDFSSGSLDSSKWYEEDTYEHLVMLDEHFVDVNVYHNKQNIAANDEIRLSMIQDIYAGDVIEYDANYISGSGNLISRIFVNDAPADRWFLDNGFAADTNCPGLATCGDIGYWNGDSTNGNKLGKYHVIVKFYDDQINITYIDPDGVHTYYPSPIGIYSAPYKFSISTRTGHNGIGHFDYDNFKITNTQEVPEFGVIAGIIALIGVVAIFIWKRK